MFKKLFVLSAAVCFFIVSGCAQKAAIQPKLEKTIVCFGDSLTHGTGASNGETYPYFLQKFTNLTVVNAGVHGDTSQQGLDRIDEIFQFKPFMVLIEFGANDFFRKIPTAVTKKNIESIVDKIQASGATAVILCTEDNQLPELRRILVEISNDKNAPILSGILNEIWTDRTLFADDLHPNSAGYKIVAEKVYERIKPLLEKQQ
ncbi:MAG: GDSL-type esterase/lipase family protein [Endomicrobiaceae bacterium]|jgi:lysophospholipase L1-like esterase|nr:GDSL-type esterase/lipase family protein [Endomicrobiaceae bacterium]